MQSVHIPLHESLHSALVELAREAGTTKTQLARQAIETLVKERQQRRKCARMTQYAEEMAPHSGDFVAETDAIVTEQLLRETNW